MAEAPAKTNPLDALKKKVGPLPLGVWLAAGIGIWWYLRKKQASTAPAAGTPTTQAGYGTDPAGNTGYIDPQTGYVQGSPEDLAALQSQAVASGAAPAGGGASGGGDGSVSSNGSGTATSTPGAPGTGTGGTPAPGGTPINKGNWRYPAPTGLAASGVSDSGYALSWQPVQGPQGQKPATYTVATYQQNGVKVNQFVSGSTSTREYGAGGKGLHPGWTYRTDVWANGGPQAPPHASVTVQVKPKGAK